MRWHKFEGLGLSLTASPMAVTQFSRRVSGLGDLTLFVVDDLVSIGMANWNHLLWILSKHPVQIPSRRISIMTVIERIQTQEELKAKYPNYVRAYSDWPCEICDGAHVTSKHGWGPPR